MLPCNEYVLQGSETAVDTHRESVPTGLVCPLAVARVVGAEVEGNELEGALVSGEIRVGRPLLAEVSEGLHGNVSGSHQWHYPLSHKKLNFRQQREYHFDANIYFQ
jgi:hypothetical protein